MEACKSTCLWPSENQQKSCYFAVLFEISPHKNVPRAPFTQQTMNTVWRFFQNFWDNTKRLGLNIINIYLRSL